MTRLSSERLLLREFEVGDSSDVHSYASDPEVVRFMDWGAHTLEQTRAVVAEVARERDEPARTTFSLAAVLPPSGPVVGSVSITVRSTEHLRGEVGWTFGRAHWGRGHATEAARLLLEFGFGPLGLHRIEATCRPENIGSTRVMEKAGMQLEGRLRDHMLIRGAWCDSLLYAAVNPDR